MQSPQLKFRFANHSEAVGFARGLREQLGLTQNQLPDDWRWVIAEGPRVEAYLAPSEVASSLEELLKSRMPYSLGLFAGGVEYGELQVSLELATRLAHLLPKRKIVVLRSEAEQPVLYGRDVLAGSIHSIEDDVRKGELVVLTNLLGEVLALGQMLADAKELEQAGAKQRLIRNIIDKGWYLRKGG